MRSIQPKRRSSVAVWLASSFILLVLALGGVLASLYALGFNINPFARGEDPFVVRLPINSQPIPAYARVERTHMLDPRTGGLMYQKVPPRATRGMSLKGVASDGHAVESKVADVKSANGNVVFLTADGHEVPQENVQELGGAILNISAIIGRVMKRDKRVGLAFRDDLFFPQGTPEGISGATPPGMRTVTLDASKLVGVHALGAGDRIDLLASVPIGEVGSFQTAYSSRLPGAALVAAAADTGKSSGVTEPVLLAKNAVVLKPVYVRNETTASASLTEGKRLQNVPKYEVAIAVVEDDVIPLQSALDRKLEITCITQSMQPTSVTAGAPASAPEMGPLAPVTVRPILAYDVVVRDAFVNPATRRPRLEPVSQQEIDRLGIVTSFDEALGSVARRDIPAGSFLRKADLLTKPLDGAPLSERPTRPETTPSRTHFTALAAQHQHAEPTTSRAERTGSIVGDRPAVTSFIPAGYTAFALPWNRLYGAEYLEIGDHIDLLASYSLERENREEETETRPDGTTIVRKKEDIATRQTRRTWDETMGARGEPWFVATEAIVVGPVGFPPPAPAQRALGDALSRSTPGAAQGSTAYSGPPMIVAVDDRDVENLAAALATQRVLFTPTFHRSEEHTTIPTGMKRIAIAAQDIEAYERLQETAWHGNRRRPMWRLVGVDDERFAGAVEEHDVPSFYGRVLRRAKRRGDFLTEEDFLPRGAEPGLAAAAARGTTIFSVADREIEGLDSFQTGDQIAILLRGVVKPPSGVIAHGFSLRRPVSSVVVPQARIVRASRRGQTALEIDQQFLTRLQAAWAASLARDDEQADDIRRSHLLAVALPREVQVDAAHLVHAKAVAEPAANIPSFDPLRDVKLLETLVGKRSEVHAFAGRNAGELDQPLNFVAP